MFRIRDRFPDVEETPWPNEVANVSNDSARIFRHNGVGFWSCPIDPIVFEVFRDLGLARDLNDAR